jgi:hypothetical protein
MRAVFSADNNSGCSSISTTNRPHSSSMDVIFGVVVRQTWLFRRLSCNTRTHSLLGEQPVAYRLVATNAGQTNKLVSRFGIDEFS